MNIGTNAMPQTLESQVVAPTEVSAARRFYWSLRREFWESRSIYLAPLAVALLFLLGFAVSTVHLPGEMRAAAALDPVKQQEAIAQPYDFAAALLMLSLMIVGAFYSLDALYGERRDRSILFWKSLPLSDLTTVLAKASIPLVLLPLLAFGITIVTQFIMLLLSSVVLAASGQSVATLWNQLSFVRMSLLLLYHLVTAHGLWQWPIYGWLLLVSAWAPRAPFVWAFLPPLALCYLEKIAFNTTHFLSLLRYRLEGNGMEAITVAGTLPMNPMTQLTPLRFLSSPGLWIGLALTAVFIAAAVRMRRYRGPI